MTQTQYSIRAGSGSRFIMVVLVFIGLAALVFMMDTRRRAAEDQLHKMTMQLEQLQTGNTAQNREAADKVIAQLSKLIDIPEGMNPTVATIVDVEKLKERNAFYAKAKNGDHLVVTAERAILFDSKQNKILDVVPVQVQAPTETAPVADEAEVPTEEVPVEEQSDESDVPEEVVEVEEVTPEPEVVEDEVAPEEEEPTEEE